MKVIYHVGNSTLWCSVFPHFCPPLILLYVQWVILCKPRLPLGCQCPPSSIYTTFLFAFCLWVFFNALGAIYLPASESQKSGSVKVPKMQPSPSGGQKPVDTCPSLLLPSGQLWEAPCRLIWGPTGWAAFAWSCNVSRAPWNGLFLLSCLLLPVPPLPACWNRLSNNLSESKSLFQALLWRSPN